MEDIDAVQARIVTRAKQVDEVAARRDTGDDGRPWYTDLALDLALRAGISFAVYKLVTMGIDYMDHTQVLPDPPMVTIRTESRRIEIKGNRPVDVQLRVVRQNIREATADGPAVVVLTGHPNGTRIDDRDLYRALEVIYSKLSEFGDPMPYRNLRAIIPTFDEANNQHLYSDEWDEWQFHILYGSLMHNLCLSPPEGCLPDFLLLGQNDGVGFVDVLRQRSMRVVNQYEIRYAATWDHADLFQVRKLIKFGNHKEVISIRVDDDDITVPLDVIHEVSELNDGPGPICVVFAGKFGSSELLDENIQQLFDTTFKMTQLYGIGHRRMRIVIPDIPIEWDDEDGWPLRFCAAIIKGICESPPQGSDIHNIHRCGDVAVVAGTPESIETVRSLQESKTRKQFGLDFSLYMTENFKFSVVEDFEINKPPGSDAADVLGIDDLVE